ncbi:hypothetical protein FPRO04_12444 [Fusarium proliferatum]|nr:hypothetical protein FPRO04_12444 [Fusarium proliferatum]
MEREHSLGLREEMVKGHKETAQSAHASVGCSANADEWTRDDASHAEPSALRHVSGALSAWISIEESTQALDIFLNHYAKSAKNLASIGSSKSFSLQSDAARGDIGSGLEVVRDCFSSARGATFRVLININPSHGAFYHTGLLSMLMTSHVVRNTIKLERFLKSLRIQTAHLLERRNRANEAILHVKTIFGLARTDDGHGLAHPPPVKKHGTGADDVEFWLDGKASSPGTPQAAVRADTRKKSKGKGK